MAPTSSVNPSFSGLTIICLAWAAIAAIGWGFYFGFKGRNKHIKDPETHDSASYEYQCCARIPKASPTNTVEPSVASNKSQPITRSFKYSKKPVEGDTVSNATVKSYKPIEPQNIILTQSQPIVAKKSYGPSESTKNIPLSDRKKSEFPPSKGNRIVTVPSPVSVSENPGCLCCQRKGHPEDPLDRPSTASQFSQKILQEDVQTLSKSAYSGNQKSDPTAFRQGSNKKYDFDHVQNATPSRENEKAQEIKPEVKEIKELPIDNSNKVMRPVPTFSATSPHETASQTKNTELRPQANFMQRSPQAVPIMPQAAPIIQQRYPNFIILQSPQTSPCTKKGEINLGPCCANQEKRTVGSIRPIIDGYKVEGHLKVKGTKHNDLISVPEDSYEVIP